MSTLIAVDYAQGIEDAWAKIATFVPKFAGFLVILFIGYFIAKTLAKVADRVLERVGFDKLVERGGVKKALERAQYDASDILAKVVFWAIFLIVLQMAFGVFGANPVSTLLAAVVAYLPKVFIAVVIIVVAAAIASAVKDILESSLGGLSYGRALSLTASALILTIGAFAALNQLEIAPAVVNGLFYAMLAIVVGSAVIAIGGGGIQPMRGQWERALAKIDEEAPRLKQQAKSSSGSTQNRFEERKAQATGAAERVSSGANLRNGGS